MENRAAGENRGVRGNEQQFMFLWDIPNREEVLVDGA